MNWPSGRDALSPLVVFNDCHVYGMHYYEYQSDKGFAFFSEFE